MKADNEQILVRLLEESGALRRGHFQLSSGLHSTAYVQCALLLEDPARARGVGQALAEELRPHHPDSVLSPALGGMIIGHEVAAALGVPFRFTERKGDELGFRRGFTLRPGEQVVIVEDVVTTGRSTLESPPWRPQGRTGGGDRLDHRPHGRARAVRRAVQGVAEAGPTFLPAGRVPGLPGGGGAAGEARQPAGCGAGGVGQGKDIKDPNRGKKRRPTATPSPSPLPTAPADRPAPALRTRGAGRRSGE